MSNYKSPLITAGMILFLFAPTQSFSAVLASDNFDGYLVGTALTGQNGGTGFTSGWTGSGYNISTAGGGGSNAASGSGGVLRALPATVTSIFSSGTGVIYLSFDYTASAGGNSFAGLNLYQGGTERVLIGKNSYGGGTADDSQWMIARDGQLGNVTTESFTTIKTAVVRFNLAAGSGSSADLWIGSGVGAVDTTGSPNTTLTNLTLTGITQIALRGNVGSSIDNIQFTDTIPEPSTGLLASLALGFSALRRKRK